MASPVKSLPKADEKAAHAQQRQEMQKLIASENRNGIHELAVKTENFDAFKLAVDSFLDNQKWDSAGHLIAACISHEFEAKVQYAMGQFAEKATLERLGNIGGKDILLLYYLATYGSQAVRDEAMRLAGLKSAVLPE